MGPDIHFVSDEKKKCATLTESGVSFAEDKISETILLKNSNYNGLIVTKNLRHSCFPVNYLWTENMTWPVYVNSLLRARVHYIRDKDYIVQREHGSRTSRVVIIDPSTGRLMPKSRWGDNIHQAVEAIEGCDVLGETRTTASITLQALFKMYQKLAGMS